MGKYVKGCDMCQKIKNRMEVPAGTLKLSEVLEKPSNGGLHYKVTVSS